MNRLTLAALFFGAAAASACPFCAAPSLTLSEQLSQSDLALIGAWVSAQEPDADHAASTTFEVVRSLRGEAPSKEVVSDAYRAGEPGTKFLLLASKVEEGEDSGGRADEGGDGWKWSGPIEVSDATADYLAAAPTTDKPKAERLEFFLGYLEHPDETVSTDAYSEFAGAPYEDVVPLRDRMPREKLRQWVVSEDVSPTRLGLYGMMLGLCGTEEDVPLMREIVTAETGEFRLGVDGIMGGYVLLAGQNALEVIEETKLLDTTVPFSETYAAMQALRFLWTYGDGVIPPERLKQSMRVLLGRPEVADLVIADLARWKDWSLLEDLTNFYDEEGYDVPAIKRAIIRYYLAASKTKENGPDAAGVELAKAKLAELKEKDAKTYRSAERFFFLE